MQAKSSAHVDLIGTALLCFAASAQPPGRPIDNRMSRAEALNETRANFFPFGA